MIGILFFAVYVLFLSASPSGRAKGKNMLISLLVGMVIVSQSTVLLQLVLDISQSLTDSIMERANLELENLAVFSMARAEMCLMDLVFVSLGLVAIMIAGMRYFLILLLAAFFPLTLFLYFFPYTKSYGIILLRFTITLVFIQVIQALLYSITIISVVDNAGLSGFITAIGGLTGVVYSPLLGMKLMEWLGAVTHFYSTRGGGAATRFAAMLMRGQGLGSAFQTAGAQYMISHNMGPYMRGQAGAPMTAFLAPPGAHMTEGPAAGYGIRSARSFRGMDEGHQGMGASVPAMALGGARGGRATVGERGVYGGDEDLYVAPGAVKKAKSSIGGLAGPETGEAGASTAIAGGGAAAGPGGGASMRAAGKPGGAAAGGAAPSAAAGGGTGGGTGGSGPASRMMRGPAGGGGAPGGDSGGAQASTAGGIHAPGGGIGPAMRGGVPGGAASRPVAGALAANRIFGAESKNLEKEGAIIAEMDKEMMARGTPAGHPDRKALDGMKAQQNKSLADLQKKKFALLEQLKKAGIAEAADSLMAKPRPNDADYNRFLTTAAEKGVKIPEGATPKERTEKLFTEFSKVPVTGGGATVKEPGHPAGEPLGSATKTLVGGAAISAPASGESVTVKQVRIVPHAATEKGRPAGTGRASPTSLPGPGSAPEQGRATPPPLPGSGQTPEPDVVLYPANYTEYYDIFRKERPNWAGYTDQQVEGALQEERRETIRSGLAEKHRMLRGLNSKDPEVNLKSREWLSEQLRGAGYNIPAEHLEGAGYSIRNTPDEKAYIRETAPPERNKGIVVIPDEAWNGEPKVNGAKIGVHDLLGLKDAGGAALWGWQFQPDSTLNKTDGIAFSAASQAASLHEELHLIDRTIGMRSGTDNILSEIHSFRGDIYAGKWDPAVVRNSLRTYYVDYYAPDATPAQKMAYADEAGKAFDTVMRMDKVLGKAATSHILQHSATLDEFNRNYSSLTEEGMKFMAGKLPTGEIKGETFRTRPLGIEEGRMPPELQGTAKPGKPSVIRRAAPTVGAAAGMTALRAFTHDQLDERTWHETFPNIPFTTVNVGRVLGLPEGALAYQTRDIGQVLTFAHETAKTSVDLGAFAAADYAVTKGGSKVMTAAGAGKAGSWLAKHGAGKVAGPAFAALSGWTAFSDIDFTTASEWDVNKRAGGAIIEGALAGAPFGGPIGAVAGATVATGSVMGRALWEVRTVRLEGEEGARMIGVQRTIDDASKGWVKHDSLPDNAVTKDVTKLMNQVGTSQLNASMRETGLLKGDAPLSRKEVEKLDGLLAEREALKARKERLEIELDKNKDRIAARLQAASGESIGSKVRGLVGRPLQWGVDRELSNNQSDIEKLLNLKTSPWYSRKPSLPSESIERISEANGQRKLVEQQLETYYKRGVLREAQGKNVPGEVWKRDELAEYNAEFVRRRGEFRNGGAAAEESFIKSRLPLVDELLENDPKGINKSNLKTRAPDVYNSKYIQDRIGEVDAVNKGREELNQHMQQVLRGSSPEDQERWKKHMDGEKPLTPQEWMGLLDRIQKPSGEPTPPDIKTKQYTLPEQKPKTMGAAFGESAEGAVNKDVYLGRDLEAPENETLRDLRDRLANMSGGPAGDMARSVLGVSNDASRDEIKRAHRRLVSVVHPDKAAEGQREASEIPFKAVQDAYDYLNGDVKESDFRRNLTRAKDSVSVTSEGEGEPVMTGRRQITGESAAKEMPTAGTRAIEGEAGKKKPLQITGSANEPVVPSAGAFAVEAAVRQEREAEEKTSAKSMPGHMGERRKTEEGQIRGEANTHTLVEVKGIYDDLRQKLRGLKEAGYDVEEAEQLMVFVSKLINSKEYDEAYRKIEDVMSKSGLK
ncbi:MAG: DnaJ domain-containing protein [Candidatus Altiarchaeota archaeon]|nr:DnaJ domain-containing protein [Candidatus Altiarchaeota archaeon]